MEKDPYSIENTTKEERIELIRSWVPDDETGDENTVDIWEMYREYIEGNKEIAEINAAFSCEYQKEEEE